MGFQRNHGFKVGVETVYGDGGATPTFLPIFYEDARPTMDIQKFENPVYSGSLGRSKMWFGRKFYNMPFKFYLKGSGTAGTAPEIGKLFRGAGLQETIVAVTSVTYSPRDTGFESINCDVNLDGTQYSIAGTRIESLKINLEAGNPPLCEGTLKGIFLAPTVVSFPVVSFADAAVTPPVAEGMAITIGGGTFVLRKFSVELKQILGVRDSINAVAGSGGVKQIDIIGREWGGTFTVEVDTANDVEFYTNLMAATEMAVASTGFGSTGNKIKISTSTLQLEDIKPAADQGMTTYDVTFRINKHATPASEFSLQFI